MIARFDFYNCNKFFFAISTRFLHRAQQMKIFALCGFLWCKECQRHLRGCSPFPLRVPLTRMTETIKCNSPEREKRN